jgi:bifunctional DNA-binding transcriptional regulator/antitoxin component of YhaV-PrlF toxin-antitoxin module
MTQQAKVIDGGKGVIRADIRREPDIKQDDSLVVERDSAGAVVLKTYAQVCREVQQRFRDMRRAGGAAAVGGGSVVDESIADRREEARREDVEDEAWLACRL